MNELVKNWINFFRNSSLTTEKSSEVFDYISSFSPDSTLSLNDIQQHCSISAREIKKNIEMLVTQGLLAFDYRCPDCNYEFAQNKFYLNEILECPECECEIASKDVQSLIVLAKASSKQSLLRKIEEQTYERNAKLLSQIGIDQSELIYVITDIVGSERLQRTDNEKYLEYLDYLWRIFWPSMFRKCRKPYLPVLAKGDAVSLVLSSVEDLLVIYESFRVELNFDDNLKLSFLASKIPFPTKNSNGFVRSIDKKWDLNTPEVTNIYRDSASINPDEWKSEQEFRLKYIFINEIINDICEYNEIFRRENIKDYKYKGKHAIFHEGQYIAGLL